jgi:Plant transposon protein
LQLGIAQTLNGISALCIYMDHSRIGMAIIVNQQLECVVDCYLWIWFMNFGNAGSLNDINIFEKSSIVSSIWKLNFDLKCPEYCIHNITCDVWYFSTDGIYPLWSIFVNTIRSPITDIDKCFLKQEEGCWKDVEQVFAVLENKFQILKNALRLHLIEYINDILHCCIILHNMMVGKQANNTNNNSKNKEYININNGHLEKVSILINLPPQPNAVEDLECREQQILALVATFIITILKQ